VSTPGPGSDGPARTPPVPTEADVADLRDRLDEIRRLLDGAGVPPAPAARPVAHPSRSRRRTARWLWPVAAGTAAAAGGVLVAALLTGDPSPGGAPAADDRPAAAAPAPDGAWPGTDGTVPSGLVTTGPGADAPGTDVVVAPAADGRTLEVYERVVPSAPGARWLRLSRPDPQRLSGVTLPTDLTVTGLTVTNGGSPSDVRSAPGGWVVTAADGQSLGPVTLRYRVEGGVTSTPDAPAGRRLLLVWPLAAEASRGTGTDVVVHPDPSQVVVRQMLCPLATPEEQLCGSAGGPGWTGRVPGGTGGPLMVVQVDPAAT
jgi:hypothetical protein